MSMSGKLQTRIAPITSTGIREFSKVETPESEESNPDKVEFHKLLQNSNADVARERMAKKSGDLSGAKTDEEFRKMLADKSNPQKGPKNTLDKDDFMKLFIAQMQTQDPLNPQDASQMSAQMAQFNSLEQMMNLNKTMENMLKGQAVDRAVGMVNYVGKEVDVGTGVLKWDKNKLTKSTFEVGQPLANALVEVRDASGQIVAQQDLGNVMPGEHNVKWDGKLKNGTSASSGVYNFSIVGKTTDGQEVTVPIKSKVKVTGIDLQSEGGAFFTEIGKLDVKDIASVGIQGFDEAKAAVNMIEKTAQQPGKDSDPAPSPNDGQAAQDGSANQGTPLEASRQVVSEENAVESAAPPPYSPAGENPAEVESSSAVPTQPAPVNIPITFAGQ